MKEAAPVALAQVRRWAAFERPARVLIYLLIGLSIVEIYDRASFLVLRVLSVALLFVFAAAIAMLLTPAVDHVQRVVLFRRHRIAAVLAVFAVLLLLAAGLAALIIPTLVDQAQQIPALADRAKSLVGGLQSNLRARGIPIDLGSVGNAGGGALLGSAVDVLASTLTAIVDLLLVIVISIYLLTQGRELIAAARRLFPGHTDLVDFTLFALGTTLAAYVRGQLIMSALMGTYTALTLSILGVHYAILLGLVAALLELIPLAGASISMVLITAVALIQSPTLAVLAAVAGLGGHALDAYIVGPRVNAHVVRLHPLAAMAALLMGAELAGIVGAVFAVPMAAVANILLGAVYRARRGEHPLTTDSAGDITPDSLPRLGEEISEVRVDPSIEGELKVAARRGIADRTRERRRRGPSSARA